MLRDSPLAWRLHRIYLLLKLPLVMVAALATWWTYSGLMSGLFANSPGAASTAGSANIGAIFLTAFWTGISLIYPIALLVVLSTRTSREQFHRISTGVTA
jgi:uncharacterized membrane protein